MSTNQESNLKRALRELQGKHHNWKSIGQALGVPPQDIAITESNHRDNGERCLEEVLRYWFRNYRDPSWEELSKALNTSEATRLSTSESKKLQGAGNRGGNLSIFRKRWAEERNRLCTFLFKGTCLAVKRCHGSFY